LSVSTLRISLPQTSASPAQARRQVTRFAEENDVLGRASVALLVLSELVTNAVLYGCEPIQVCVSRRPDALLIEVSDGDADTSQIAPQARRAPEQAGGRGLKIVNSLARDWGVTSNDDGTTVWAEVGFDETDAEPRA
jgi:anti-sigma regulatory factor (Ser/Thr protein kinase)